MSIRAEAEAPRNGFDRAWVAAPLLCGLAALGLAWAWGPADRATPDSAFYIDGARHLAAGHGFASAVAPFGEATPRPIAKFAPGLSVLMTPALWAGFDERQSAALVLGASLVAYALASCLLLVTASGRALWPAALLATALLVARPGSLTALDSILSDLPAAACSTFGCWLALRLVLAEPPSRRTALAVGGCFAAAALVRWSALLLLLPLAGSVWLALRERLATRAGLRLLAGIAVLPALGVGPWLLRNLVHTGTLMGARPFALSDPVLVGTSALQGAFAGFVDSRDLLGPKTLACFVYTWLAFVGAALWFWVFVRSRAWEHPVVRVCLGALLGYALLLAVSASFQPIDPLFKSRFWLPAWPLLWAVVLATLARATARAALRLAVAVGLLVPGLFSLGLFGFHIARSLPEAGAGQEFLAEPWVSSADAIAETLDANPGCAVVSNDPRALVIHRALARVQQLPRAAPELRRLLAGDGHLCIVFFKAGSRSVEKRSAREWRMLEQLGQEGRIRRIGGDAVADVWTSS